MNNKGFTIIELLAVVSIISVLGIIITISFTKSLGNANQKQCDQFVKEVEDAACVYAGLSKQDPDHYCNRNLGSCDLSVQFLLENGYINSEVDSCTGTDIDTTKSVHVSWDSNGNKTCVYNGVKTYAG